MTERERIDAAATALVVELMPWQRELGARLLGAERVVVYGGRRSGISMVRRAVEKAREHSVTDKPQAHTEPRNPRGCMRVLSCGSSLPPWGDTTTIASGSRFGRR